MERWRVPEELRGRDDVRLYGEALFAEAVAHDLGLTLLDPAPDWLAHLPAELLGRIVLETTLEQARELEFPRFVKAVDDKLGGLPGRVYERASDIVGDNGLAVQTSEPVDMQCELRLWCAHGEVVTGSGYWRDGAPWQPRLEDSGLEREAVEIAGAACEQARKRLPDYVVLDVARLRDGPVVVVEANGAWGAAVYEGHDVDAALHVILQASLPRAAAATVPAAVRRDPPPVDWGPT
jgi:hypothetical protein